MKKDIMRSDATAFVFNRFDVSIASGYYAVLFHIYTVIYG